jgi:hypothetical protein
MSWVHAGQVLSLQRTHVKVESNKHFSCLLELPSLGYGARSDPIKFPDLEEHIQCTLKQQVKLGDINTLGSGDIDTEEFGDFAV